MRSFAVSFAAPHSCRAVTALQARTFAVWTLTSAVIRFYAAYNINNKTSVPLFFSRSLLTRPSFYDMAFISYLIAFGHFSSELLIFRTATLNAGVISPVIVSSAFSLRTPTCLLT